MSTQNSIDNALSFSLLSSLLVIIYDCQRFFMTAVVLREEEERGSTAAARLPARLCCVFSQHETEGALLSSSMSFVIWPLLWNSRHELPFRPTATRARERERALVNNKSTELQLSSLSFFLRGPKNNKRFSSSTARIESHRPHTYCFHSQREQQQQQRN